MTIKELVELEKGTEFFNLQKKLNIKKYIPIMDKKEIAMDVIAACTDDFNGFVEIDRFKMDIYFHMSLMGKYANIDVSFDFDKMVEEYDMLNENNIMYEIIEYFAEDYRKCQEVLDGELAGILVQNSLEAQVVTVVNKVNALLDEIGAKLGSVDLNSIVTDGVNLGELAEVVKLLK